MRGALLALIAQVTVAVKFCTNGYLPSGSCPANAVAICAANSGAYCIKAGLQYPVANVNGCEKFQAGSLTGACHQIGNEDTEPTQFPYCNPQHRNYCECTECTSDANCSSIGGLPSVCAGNATGSGDIYASAFAAGAESISCVDSCAQALRKAYSELDQC